MTQIEVSVVVQDSVGNVGTATTTASIENQFVDVGASSFKPGFANRLTSAQALDADLAAAVGASRPIMRFWHTYSDHIPSSFSASSAAQSVANGWGSMLNIKAGSGVIRTPAGRQALINFLLSVPAALKILYLIFRHEPENDNLMLAEREAWRLDMAEFVKIVLDFGNPKIIPGSCFMGDPPVHWEEFNFFPLLRPGDVGRMINFFDAYPRCRTSPDRTDDPGFKYDTVCNWLRSKGAVNLGIGETTLNGDAGIAQSLRDHWWAVKLPNWLAANKDVKVVAVYDSSGPAAGTDGYIDSPGELQAVARLMIEGH